MKSFTTLKNLFGSLTNNTETTNLTLGAQWINDGIRRIISMPFNWDFLEKTTTDVTVASQQSYQLPYNYEKLNSVTVTVGTYVYPVKEVSSLSYWNSLNLVTSFTSTYPQWFFVQDGNLKLWPIPSASSNTITYNYKVAVKDLSVADYTTGTVTLTNASTVVTGAGTTFTSAMPGRYLQATNDGFWYELSTFTSTTVMNLRKKFQGITTAGLAYIVGEMPVLPESYHDLPVFYAASQYWYQNGDAGRGQQYERLFNEGIARLVKDHGLKTTSLTIGGEEPILNPNYFISL